MSTLYGKAVSTGSVQSKSGALATSATSGEMLSASCIQTPNVVASVLALSLIHI